MVGLFELSELLRQGENSGVEFKRDDVQPHDLAKELVALSNLRVVAFCSASRTTARSAASSAMRSTSGS
jgi:predicted HTH transcriptional regulator